MCVIDGHADYVLTTEPHVYGEGIPTIAIQVYACPLHR